MNILLLMMIFAEDLSNLTCRIHRRHCNLATREYTMTPNSSYFVTGTMAIANIFEHMTRSNKVIVVLTKNYVKAGINVFELDQATTLYNDQDIDDIIVIKVGHVPSGKVPVHLYTQMRTGKFLEWEDNEHAVEQFKEKLKDRLRDERVDLC